MAWTTPTTFVVGQLLTAGLMNAISNNLSADNTAGSLKYVCSTSAGNATESQWQSGWLECNGAAVSRTTYSSLFNYLNGLSTPLPYGTGNGTTTFNVPDFQGRLPMHVSNSGPSIINTIGKNEGLANTLRTISHHHTTSVGQTSGAGVSGSAGGVGGNSSGSWQSDGDANNSDYPSFLVAGIWVVKF